MSAHLVFKFQYLGWSNPNAGETIALHEEVIKKHGSVWWGRVTGISVHRLETLRNQIARGVETYAFLYEVDTPKKIHADQKRWFRAQIAEIQLGKPKDTKFIPAYYRDRTDLEMVVRFSKIEKISYKTGTTPRLPGQTSIRHASLRGAPVPENLVSLEDANNRLCKIGSDSQALEELMKPMEINYQKSPVPSDLNLALKVISLQEEVIQLQQQLDDLKSYKEYYNKILNTDYLFSSEKFFETWIQDNMHKIFPELEVIDRQPHMSWPDGKFGRMDLLAMNKENGDLAIIEVKTRKRSKKTGYDQYVRYTSWVKRNLELLKSNYVEHKVKPTSEPQFIIISDFIDEEMKAICNDHGITLVHIFGGLGIERASL